MFTYFGCKTKSIHLYPKPRYDKIIEPFCGSARYALKYYKRDVWINDLYPVIYEVWKWIQQATKEDARALPKMRKGDRLDDERILNLNLPQPAMDLLGFTIGQARTRPSKQMVGWSVKELPQLKSRLIQMAGKLNHWKITNLSYEEIPNQEATWFLDPPYMKLASHYKHSEIDYDHLAKWVLSRKGQVIVCEGEGADWLPFIPILKNNNRVRGCTKTPYQELIYHRSDRKTGFGLI